MHNTTFIPHTSSTQPPSSSSSSSSSSTNKRASGSNYPSVTKPGLKRRPSSDSLLSIGRKPPKTVGSTGTSTSTRTGTRTIISTSTTATTVAKTSITTAASSSASSISRGPLKKRNQNAAPVTIPLLKEPGTGNMPFDTSSPPLASPNPNSSRSQMSSLSASAARVVNRNPLTPKIASKSGAQSPALSTTATPASRRQHTPGAINTNREILSNRSSYFDDSSSIPSHLSTNVTPRSGPRQTRVDSANNTPNGTPNPDKSDAWDHRSSFGLPSPRIEGDTMRRSGIFGSASPDTSAYGRQEVAHNLESKFFHASDAKPPRPMSSSKPVQAKGPTFFYANGNTVENKPSYPTSSASALGHSQDNLSSKFMYANGIPEMRSSPTPPVSRSSGSTVSTAPRQPSSRPATNPSASNHAPVQRPSSPARFSSQTSQVSSKTANIPPLGRPQVVSVPQLAPSPGLRRSSTGTSRPGGHSRAGSLIKQDHGSNTPKPTSSRVSPETTSPPMTVPPTPAPLTLASIIQAAEEFGQSEEWASPEEAPEETPSGLQSPTNPANPAEPMNELVANARRERKVQDLQITNASLEAINRTLERQLRKQTSELRRYQRLSRSGRLSTAAAAVPTEILLEGISEQGTEAVDLSDLDEKSEAEAEEGGEEEEEMEEELSDSDSLNESLSPSIVEERDAKHRKRDEERLQLDLSKHQQLLVDSQKINQSIRRCLDWTEVLINEGRKALEYRVPITGVELGGRVLVLDEEEDRPSTANSISDNTIGLDEKFLDDPISLASWGGSERQDRDSGIELQVDGG
ncbi:hypothetical protein F5Y11DRAFT_361312 [Daldinia sp. FL1419]|nr:hypothetical protein F5Y11DRAFT_361312 [Daldinia sp. FL1419]